MIAGKDSSTVEILGHICICDYSLQKGLVIFQALHVVKWLISLSSSLLNDKNENVGFASFLWAYVLVVLKLIEIILRLFNWQVGDVDKMDCAFSESDVLALVHLKQENRELKERLVFSLCFLRTVPHLILFNSFLCLQIREIGRRDSRGVQEWFSVWEV